MKVQAKKLAEALTRAFKAVRNNHAKDVMRYALAEFGATAVVIHGGDTESGVRVQLQPESGTKGFTTLIPRAFLEAVKLCDGLVDVTSEAGKVTLKSDRGASAFQVPDPEAYVMPKYGESGGVELPGDVVRKLARVAEISVDETATRFVLQSVRVWTVRGKVNIAATDGKGVLLSEVCDGDTGGEILVSPSALMLLNDTDVVKVSSDASFVYLNQGDVDVWCRQPQGKFPDVHAAIADRFNESDSALTVTSAALAGAVKSSLTTASADAIGVKFELSPGSISLSSQSEHGKSNMKIAASGGPDEPKSVSLDGAKVARFLSKIDQTDDVVFRVGKEEEIAHFSTSWCDYYLMGLVA
jgi:DNA polymerase III sliding clamp (beta) subunit (PCNA family)